MKILGFAGSLRAASFNRSLLKAAVELAPAGMDIETFDLAGIPPFNQELEAQPPGGGKRFQDSHQGGRRYPYRHARI